MTRWRYIRASVGLALLVLFLSSCTKKAEGPVPHRIAGIVFQEDQFFRLVLFGMREAARQEGVVLLEANSAGRPDKEIQLVNTYIAQSVDAIVISPLSATASLSALQRAHAVGITVVTYNTTVDDTIPAAYIESDQTDLGASTGRAAREFIQTHFGGKARIALLAFDSQAPEQSKQRTTGFTKEVTALPGVRIVSAQDAWLAEQAVRKAGDILTANSDINLIWAANEGGTVGAVMAVKNAGKAGKIVVFGTDTGTQLADFLLDDTGILQAVTGQQPFEIGSLALHTALDAVRGKAVHKRISLPGILLSRASPDSVRAFRQRLQTLTR
jgi:ABC-type sugar transport system substrate-binding protein